MSETGAMSWRKRGKFLKEKPQPEEPRPYNHKDTKKWCKGVKGRKHSYVWVLDTKHFYGGPKDWYVNECTNCKKQNGYCWISVGRNVPPYRKEKCKCGFHYLDSDGYWHIKE